VHIDVLTLFPEMISCSLEFSILRRAQDKGLIVVNPINIRDFSENKHRTVDDYPYGGGPGMILQAGPIVKAVESISGQPRIILFSPQGRKLSHSYAQELALTNHLLLICAHYEGFDERVRDLLKPEELSIGDYILTGGELPALVLIDAVTRLLPGTLGETAGGEHESFYDGLLEFPQYTRPQHFRHLSVPSILLSGNHAAIRSWRRRESLRRTKMRRPDLLNSANLSASDIQILEELASNPE